MNQILITGGSGFVGNALVDRLIALGHKVLITGRNNEQSIKCPCISYTFHDLNWKGISPISTLFHQAAITNTTHKPDSDFYFVNVECAQKLFIGALENGCKNFVYASSCAVYGRDDKPFVESSANPSTPINEYGRSKILFDEWAMAWAKKENVKVVGLRYSNIYGPGEFHKGKSASMIYQLMQQMKSGNPTLFKWGEQQRDFVHIDDIVNANLLASECKDSGVFNVGSGIPTSFNDIVRLINKAMSTNKEAQYFDNPIAEFYQNYTSCDLALSNKVLGYYPQTNLEKGIANYVRLSY